LQIETKAKPNAHELVSALSKNISHDDGEESGGKQKCRCCALGDSAMKNATDKMRQATLFLSAEHGALHLLIECGAGR
jgi:hypothetical protein